MDQGRTGHRDVRASNYGILEIAEKLVLRSGREPVDGANVTAMMSMTVGQ